MALHAKARNLFCGALLGALSGGSALAQTLSDPQSFELPRSAALGGSSVGTKVHEDSIFQNPASGAFDKKYSFSVQYLGVGDTVGASIVDSKSGPLAGGVSYQRVNLSNPAKESANVGSVAMREDRYHVVLMTVLGDKLGVGAKVNYNYRRSLDASVASGGGFNGDIGFLYPFAPNFSAGVLIESVLEDTKGLFGKHVSFGATFNPTPELALSAQFRQTSDPESGSTFRYPSAKRGTWGLGAEYTAPQSIFVRGGYRDVGPWDTAAITLGLGYKTEGYSLDYSASIPKRGGGSTSHAFSLAGYF